MNGAEPLLQSISLKEYIHYTIQSINMNESVFEGGRLKIVAIYVSLMHCSITYCEILKMVISQEKITKINFVTNFNI